MYIHPHFHPFIHTFTLTPVAESPVGSWQGANLLTRSNLRFSILLNDTSMASSRAKGTSLDIQGCSIGGCLDGRTPGVSWGTTIHSFHHWSQHIVIKGTFYHFFFLFLGTLSIPTKKDVMLLLLNFPPSLQLHPSSYIHRFVLFF